jgi:hypothetical protein
MDLHNLVLLILISRMYHLQHGELTMTQNVIMMLFLKVSSFTSDVMFLKSLNNFRC